MIFAFLFLVLFSSVGQILGLPLLMLNSDSAGAGTYFCPEVVAICVPSQNCGSYLGKMRKIDPQTS